jgi:hypothetical protein
MCNSSVPASPKPTTVKELPPPLDLSHHVSRVTKHRNASSVKNFYKYFSIPGIQNLAGGIHASFRRLPHRE